MSAAVVVVDGRSADAYERQYIPGAIKSSPQGAVLQRRRAPSLSRQCPLRRVNSAFAIAFALPDLRTLKFRTELRLISY